MNGKIFKSEEKNLWLFSILGYVYIAAVILGAIGIAGLIVLASWHEQGAYYAAFKTLMALGVFLFLIIKALWVKFEKPTGLEVDERNLPELARFVTEIGAEVGGPKEYEILLTEDLNASIVQYPRLGILGYYKNYVLIGAPLLMIASAEEFKGVLAHEFGHLKETHGVWAIKINRNREVWLQIMGNLEEKKHWGAFLFKRFFKWYLPKLDEYSLSMYREHEFEADRESVRVAGKEAFGGFQLKYDIYAGRISEAFWRETFRKMQTCPEPESGVFEELDRFVKIPVEKAYQKKVIAGALKAQNDDSSTHPSRKERLDAAGYDPASFELKESGAADLLLGAHKGEILKRLSESWRQEIAPYWEYKYEQYQQLQEDLEELKEAEKTENSLLIAARILGELDREEESLEKYEELLDMNPENLEAMFSKGEILISRDNTGEEGKVLLDRVMELDGEYSYLGTKLVYDYLLKQGRKEDARSYRDIGMSEAKRLEEAVEEREVVSLRDTFAPHGLSEEQLEIIVDQLKDRERLKEVYLVRKEVEHYAEEPLYILGLLFKSSSKKFMAESQQDIAENVELPGEALVMTFNEENPGFYKKHKKVENSLILKNS